MSARLIVGLGNPGTIYAQTRHNLGFMALQAFAQKHGWPFKKERRFKGELAVGSWQKGEENLKLYLLQPHTYMNLSGESVRKAVNYYHVPPQSEEGLLVIVDDVYLKFGTMRLRAQGSSGGHNGLKNIEGHLGTKNYPRLRMGVGPEEGGVHNERALEDYVLGKFTGQEWEKLPLFLDRAIDVIETWLAQGIGPAARAAGQT